jgi:hypothetical protein
MTDEDKLSQAAAKAVRAKNLIENELLVESFQGLEESYISAWRNTSIEDISAREKLFLAINVVGKVRDHLTAQGGRTGRNLPPIDPPRSWTKAEKERFQSLPRETQEYLHTREQEREREFRRGQNEAAEQRKASRPSKRRRVSYSRSTRPN